MSSSIPFTVSFSWNSFVNFLFRSVTSRFLFDVFIFRLDFSVSILVPNWFIQSRPSSGFVLFVVISSYKFFVSPLISTFAMVFPLNFLLLLLTSLYSVFNGCICVIWLNNWFGTSVTGDRLSIINLIGRLLTNAVVVKNGCPSLVFCFVEWTVLVMRCILFGDHSSSSALDASDSGWMCFIFRSVFCLVLHCFA